ncbi:MAG: replication initiation protein [Cetobacterium sp.]
MNIIKYHNSINKLKLGHFTDNETDIFFGILLKTKETKENILCLDFLELKKLIDIKNRSDDRFIFNIRNLNLKLKGLIQEIELPNGDFKVFSLFNDILTSPLRKKVEIEINQTFRYLIDDLVGNFTLIDLKQLVNLNGNYAKVLYRLLKQFESSKTYSVKINEFRDLMGIPNTYLMKNIRQKILQPSLKQLSPFFENIEVTEFKVGRQIDSLKFTWKPKEKKTSVKLIKKKKSLGEADLLLHELEQMNNNKLIVCKDIPKEEIIKIKITLEEYEALYNSYLERVEEKDNIFIRKSFDINNKNKYEIV